MDTFSLLLGLGIGLVAGGVVLWLLGRGAIARLEQGVQLLRHTGLNVREIAFRCGFASPFHFSRLVKARHGAAPRELRKGADVAGTTRGGVP